MDLSVLDRAPEAGDVEAVDGLVAGFVARAERFAARAAGVRAAGDALVGASAGAWASALGDRSGRLAGGLDDAAGGCRDVARVLADYGAAVRALRYRVTTARHEVATARIRAVNAREAYTRAALAAGVADLPWSWTDVPGHAVVPQAADELRVWRVAVDDAAAGLRLFAECCREREDLDRATAARLVRIEVVTAYAPGTGVEAVVDVPLVQAMAAAGAGTVTAAQRREMAQWFAQAAQDVGDHPDDAARLAALVGFLEAWGTDADLASDLLVGLGGDGTVRLLTGLGEQMLVDATWRNQSLAAAARAIRSALASASSTWSAPQAAAFAADMVREASSRPGARSVIGFVFADPQNARMSQPLTVVTADLIDAIERGADGPWRDGPRAPGHALDTAGPCTVLGGAAHDPAARVFETLGTYPQAARDWLTGTGVEWSSPGQPFPHERIEYWFGARDWAEGESDGFAGIGALWAGVQVEPGDLVVNRQVAAINTHVFDGLSHNSSLMIGDISSTGAVRLSSALAGQLPGLVEVGLEGGFADQKSDLSWHDATVPYVDGTVATARVSRDWVRPVLVAVAADTDARLVLHDAAMDYQTSLLAGIADGTASASEGLDGMVALWGAVDGATYSAAEVKQYLHDQQVRQNLDAGRFVVDTGAAFTPVEPLVSIGMDAVLEGVHRWTESQVTNRPLPDDATHSAVPESVGSLEEFVSAFVTENRRLGLWDGPGGHAGDVFSTPADDIARELVAKYDDIVDAMRSSASDRIRGDGQ